MNIEEDDDDGVDIEHGLVTHRAKSQKQNIKGIKIASPMHELSPLSNLSDSESQMNALQETVRNVYISKNLPHVVSIPQMDDVLEEDQHLEAGKNPRCADAQTKEQLKFKDH